MFDSIDVFGIFYNFADKFQVEWDVLVVKFQAHAEYKPN